MTCRRLRLDHMGVGTLEIIQYETSNGPWKAIRTSSPPWPAIESAVKQMDGDLFPIVNLFVDVEAASDAVPDFELLGGRVGYFIMARLEGTTLYYRDEHASSEELDVWISDQGFSCPRFMVCPDLEKVLAATRHFFARGELTQDFPWSPDFG